MDIKAMKAIATQHVFDVYIAHMEDRDATGLTITMTPAEYEAASANWWQLHYENTAAKFPGLDLRTIIGDDAIRLLCGEMRARQALLIDGRFVPVVFVGQEA